MDQAEQLRNVIKLRNQNFVDIARVITVTSGKGGVGKSNVSVNLAAKLSQAGKKVVIFDADFGLANVEVMFGVVPEYTLADMIYDGHTIKDIITRGPRDIDFISAGSSVDGLNNLTTEQIHFLVHKIDELNSMYDFIIIDCPPALGSLTINALTAADKVIVPAQADVLSLAGITQLYDSCKLVKKYTNKELEIAGILLAKHSNRTVLKRDLEEVLREQLSQQMQSKVYTATIREAVAINEAQYMQQSLFSYAGNSKVAEDYRAFIEEFLQDIKVKRG